MPTNRTHAVLIPLLAVLALLLGPVTATAQADPRARTDDYLFSRSLADFTALRSAARPGDGLVWDSDGCTLAPEHPLGYDFQPACERHDFGYRNYSGQGRFTEDARRRLDELFHADLLGRCSGKWACRRIADGYYFAVRQFGKLVGGRETIG
ncbi:MULTISPECIES: phospholipase [Actinosynnema]|uniref:phospholipase n=1 Tax=Actinosynnema TaxID=40566 RepID=UPI0020A3E1E3|nr:phospholipase [Actinosynnema pretiosum]MCP2094089.1 phospholipase A2 [Actinosynnema pretiosum]